MRLLFLGDSLIEFFDWQGRFPEHTVWNGGRAGETVQELAHRSAILKNPTTVDWLFLMIGTNNVLMGDFSFLPFYKEIVDTVQQRYPTARVVATGLFPLQVPWLSEDALPEINTHIGGVAKNSRCHFMDGYSLFQQNPPVSSCFEEDGVHLSPQGYRLWSHEIDLTLQGKITKRL